MTRRALASVALLAFCAVAGGAPPTIDIPPEVNPSGQYVQFVPKTDAVSVEYVGLDGIEPFPSAFLKDGRAFVLDSTTLIWDKPYHFVAVASGKTGETARTKFVVINRKAPGPVVTPPGPTPPVNAKFYFAVVRPDGAASAEFTKLMADPGWATLKEKGHTVKAFTVAAAKAATIEVGTTPLPAVVTLVVSADGKTSFIARPPTAAPSGTAGILKLAEFN